MDWKKFPFYFSHNKKCKITTNITPGTPKNPTNTEVNQFISSKNPNRAPTKFIKNKIAPPKNALTISFIISFRGNDINFNTINNITIAIKKLK